MLVKKYSPNKLDALRVNPSRWSRKLRYTHLIVDEVGGPVDDKDIELLEKQLGCALPDDYTAFIRACNGGYLEYSILVEFENGKSEYLSFCSLYKVHGEGDWECNPFELRHEWEGDELPPGKVLPIARDGGSSRLYLDLREGYKVAAYVQGLPEWTGLQKKDSLVVLADSFDEYLGKLTISDESIQYHVKNFDVSENSIRETLKWLDSMGTGWRRKYREIWNERILSHKI
ncbi:SMI1/KNR4 family protein [bacterium]|nr:SMI1/KNR4 family protein [bacterium]